MVHRDDKRGALLATTLLPVQWCRFERSGKSPAGSAHRADPIVDLASPTERHQQEADHQQPAHHPLSHPTGGTPIISAKPP